MENYNVYSFQVSPMSDCASDILCALLAEVGFDSFQQTDEGVEAYVLQSAEVDNDAVDALLGAFPMDDVHIGYTVHVLENRDWNEEWERTFQPIVIPGLCCIHKAEQVVERTPYDILIHPRMAFGSGTHETTSQLVELLLNDDFTGLHCLDMGCGTGILAICMALRGATSVQAVDIDEFSVENTKENCALNGIEHVDVVHGGAEVLPTQTFDVIVANIHRNIIINDMPTYVRALRAGGRLVVSGFFTEDVLAVQQAAAELNLTLVHQQNRNDWAVLIFQ
ncbi:MAG: 50S ribosomal protein L11 methyltransferase [Prevotellaceae bacterium]|nr:50S ribosomal protein L11 methyltransferase [Prevotellaceae bacterium]